MRKMNETKQNDEKKTDYVESAKLKEKDTIFHDVFETFVVFDNGVLS